MWATMNARYPQDDSPESIEGTAAHWVAWELLFDRPPLVGSAAPNGAIVTDEMLDGAELICDAIVERLNLDELHIEEMVRVPHIHPDCFGTPDAWGFSKDTGVLHVIDYKFGHRFVDEYWNMQGVAYLLGILNLLNCFGQKEITQVQFTVVQPRCFHRGESVRSHNFTVAEAHDYFQALQISATLATLPKPTARTNDYCNDCPGRHACPALQEAAYSDAEFANDRQPHDLTPNAAALELRMLERSLQRLEARVDGLRELTLANIKAGKPTPYYHVEHGKPRRVWNVPNDHVINIGDLLGVSLAKTEVVTPLQAKKLGIDEAVISNYSVIPPGAAKLVADNPSDVRKVFS